jgi:hypothetical protein
VHGDIAGKAPIPLWVMLVGATGIVLGLALYGPKLIRTVGSEITELDKTRAFCVALAAAITVAPISLPSTTAVVPTPPAAPSTSAPVHTDVTRRARRDNRWTWRNGPG